MLFPDLNECDGEGELGLANGGCERICINTQGSYHCECPTGYELGITLLQCTGRHENTC